MFTNAKGRKLESLVSAISPGILDFIASANSLERNAGLTVANAMLISGMTRWGKNFAHKPMKLDRAIILDAVTVLSEHHAKLELQFVNASGRSATDPFVSACRWEIIATQVVIITASASLGPEFADVARKSWQMLSKSRRSADEAVTAMLQYAKAYSISPVPEISGKTPDRKHLMSLATNLPPMFRPRPKVGK